MFDKTELLNMYKSLVMYCGDPTFYPAYNAKLRKTFKTKSFFEILKPFTNLAILNRHLGLNEHVISYRGIELRSKPYSKSERENKKFQMFINSFPYNSKYSEILKSLITTGKNDINQLLSTTRDLDFGLRMSDVEYFKYPGRNTQLASNQTHIFMQFHILKKTQQINVPELYKYFKKLFSFDELGLDKEIIQTFLIHVADAKTKIDEIIIVPNNEQYITNHVETSELFLSRKTKFKAVQEQILKNYYKQFKTKDILDLPLTEKEEIIQNSYFIDIKL
jgi:hypothetical protein